MPQGAVPQRPVPAAETGAPEDPWVELGIKGCLVLAGDPWAEVTFGRLVLVEDPWVELNITRCSVFAQDFWVRPSFSWCLLLVGDPWAELSVWWLLWVRGSMSQASNHKVLFACWGSLSRSKHWYVLGACSGLMGPLTIKKCLVLAQGPWTKLNIEECPLRAEDHGPNSTSQDSRCLHKIPGPNLHPRVLDFC